MLKTVFQNTRDIAASQERARSAGIRLDYRAEFADQAGSYDAKMRDRYFSFWDQMPLEPEEVAAALTEGLLGGPDDLAIKDLYLDPIMENGIIKGLNVETKFVPRSDLERYSNHIYLNHDRIYDFTSGTCKNGDIRTNGLKTKGLGRLAVRNALQLGHALGCSKVEISSTRIGCLLWLQEDAYDVVHVNPEYTKRIQKRWGAIENHCPEQIDREAIRKAIETQDLRVLAAHSDDIGSALVHTTKGRHGHDDITMSNGSIPLNRYLLHDYMIDCWQGRADMDNPVQRDNLGRLYGGWTTEQLKPAPTLITSNDRDFF